MFRDPSNGTLLPDLVRDINLSRGIQALDTILLPPRAARKTKKRQRGRHAAKSNATNSVSQRRRGHCKRLPRLAAHRRKILEQPGFFFSQSAGQVPIKSARGMNGLGLVLF